MTIASETTPEGTIQSFSDRLNSGDLEGALALYDRDAVFVAQPGQVVQGLAEIRSALGNFVALRPTLTGSIVNVLRTGDTALVINDWTLTGSAPDGSSVKMAGRSADVLRITPEGTWRVIIDNPWGS